ncbi:MAG: hypothetical protein VXB01_10685 [Opitutae bacterium]
MNRQEKIEYVTHEAVTSYEWSCSWSSAVEVIVEELRHHNLKPTKPLVFYILNLAKLSWAGETARVKKLIAEA